MKIQESDKTFFDKMIRGDRRTLSDAQTRLVIEAAGEMLIVKVDNGIIKDVSHGIRKSDYLAYGFEKPYTHLIELKGNVIDAAYEQLEATIQNINTESSYGELVAGRERVDAYIVSPNAQSIPRGINNKEKKLARVLAKRSLRPPENMLDLIHYVKIVPKAKQATENNNRIICSGKAPLVLE